MRLSGVLTALVLLALAGAAGFWLLTQSSELPAAAFSQRNADLANGEAMFNAGNCASCHQTTGVKDRTRLGGGYAMASPFGTFKAPNISQHRERGIGAWSEREFATAMLKGVGRSGEHLYPAFPYTSYQRMRLDDVRDLYAFMKTLPADDKLSEPHQLSFPFNIRRGLGLWKLVNLDGRPFAPDPAKSAAINRGAYLVEGPAHCVECHSPRNFMGAIPSEQRFAGGADGTGKNFVPNITQHGDGIAKWSEADIAEMLATGFTPDDKVGPPMSEVVENTARLSAADRLAMAAYLKTLPPRPGRASK